MKKLFYTPFPALVLLFSMGFFLDQRISLFIAEDRYSWLRDLASLFTDLASARPWFIVTFALLTAAYVPLRFSRSEPGPALRNLFNWSAHLFLALLGTGAAVHVLKIALGRARPCIALPDVQPLKFEPFHFQFDYNSFPSGHTQVIFCVATFLAILFPRSRYPAFFTALLIAATRVLVLKHFPSDVLGGILIGTYGSYLSLRVWSAKIPSPTAWPFAKAAKA